VPGAEWGADLGRSGHAILGCQRLCKQQHQNQRHLNLWKSWCHLLAGLKVSAAVATLEEVSAESAGSVRSGLLRENPLIFADRHNRTADLSKIVRVGCFH